MIRFDQVTFGYGAQPLFDRFSLEVPAGQFLGVIGPNGAGKSTLVRLALGLVAPRAGRVFVEGRALGDWRRRDLARRVAAVLQEEALEFPFTAEEVVAMGRTPWLGPLGLERADDHERVRRAMQETDVADLGPRPLPTLSGGERKRVFLARALAQDPGLLILDEPAAALDLQHQLSIFERLAERHRRGTTVIVVVHDLNLAAAYCDRLLLLRSDAAPVAGTVDEILSEARLREAFGVEVWIGKNERTGTRVVLPAYPRS